MPFDPEIQMKKHIVEAWGLWYVHWQTQKKEQLRRHAMSTQVRLKEFEKHLSLPVGKGLLADTTGSLVLPPN
jgi:hypothetical protein